MTKPRRVKSNSPSPQGAPSVSLTMDKLYHMMVVQFEKLET